MKNTVILGSAILILTMLLSQVSYAQQSVAPYAFRTVQAENATEISGLTTNSNRAFGADPGDYLRFDNVNLNGGMDSFRLRYAKGNSTESRFELRLDSLDGPIISSGVTIATNNIGSFDRYRTVTYPAFSVDTPSATLFLVFTDFSTGNIDLMQFGRGQRILFQAERANETQNTSLTGNRRAVIFDGDTTSNLEFSNVQLGNGFRTIRTRYSKGNGGDATLTVHRGSPDTPAIATVQLPNTGSDNTFRARNATFPVNENDASPIFFRVGGDGVANIDWIDFINQPPTVSFDAGDSDVQVRAGIFNRGNGQLNVDINGEPSFIRFNNTSLSYKPTVRVRYALGDGPDLQLEVRQNGFSGRLLGTTTLSSTGGFNTYQDTDVILDNLPHGVRNLTLVFRDHNQGNIESVTILQRSELPAQNQHLYGFADDGSPFCSPEYDGSIVFTVGPPPVPFGFEDTDLDGLGNSCVVQGVVDPDQDLTAQDVDFFAFAGQSNAEGHFTEGSIGVDAFRNTIFNRTGFDTLVINEAVGGSSSHDVSLIEREPFWWNLQTGQPGPLLIQAVDSIRTQSNNTGRDIDGIVWAQGENEANILTFNVDVAQILNNYSEATIAIFNHFRAEFGSDLPIFVQEIGDFTPEPDPNAPNNNGDTYSLVRTAQQTVINSQANTFLAAETSGQIPELTLRGDRLHFNGDSYGVIATRLANTAVNVIADDSSVGGNESGLTHFGQPVTLVGANTPWTDVDGDTYAENFGALGINQTAITNRFADYFNDISSNQGNSARVWLHTTTRNTPIINAGGFVTGLSNLGIDPNTGQDRAIGQLRDILDRAWENGILITFSLFSFDMLCDSTVLDFGESTDELISHQSFLQNNNNQVQSYIDNALLPMVNSLRGHPALFAWEIFNEPEGMIQDFTAAGNFCRGGALTHSTNITAIQNFITQTAIAIHNADPDVKVTTSSNTTDLENFTNDRLREVTGSNSNRILDFYQVHWYATPPEFPHLNPPHLFGPEAYTFDIDVPIVVGEYDVTDTGLELFGGNNPAPNQTGRGSRLSVIDILDRGYAGAWPWSIVTESSQNVGLIYEALRQPGLGLTQTQRNAICNTTNHEVCNN